MRKQHEIKASKSFLTSMLKFVVSSIKPEQQNKPQSISNLFNIKEFYF